MLKAPQRERKMERKKF